MRNFILLFILTLTLIGCGGGGGGDSTSSTTSSTIPKESYSGISYDTWEYIVPNTSSMTTKSLSSYNADGTSYNATFRTIEEDSQVEEIPNNGTSDERVVYTKNDTTIKVTFYKNDNIVYSYEMKRSVKMGEPTIDNSSCMLTNHYDSISLSGSNYQDVIQIACGGHKGYYAKGKGQVYQE